MGSTTTINTSLGSISATQVTYAPKVTTGKATADRLYTLVNTAAAAGLNWGMPILITPLNGGTDPYTGNDLAAKAGETFLDTANPVIHVVYDISQCGGAGFYVLDASGNHITFPGSVLLYHELSHAYHYAINQLPYPQDVCSGVSGDEPAAEVDENVLRTELGLCQRNPCSHDGGCGSGSDCGGMSGAPSGGSPASGASSNVSGVPSGMNSGVPSGMASGVPSGAPSGMPSGTMNHPASGGSPGGCFIVSAATESIQSTEVATLQQLRRQIRATSGLCDQLIDGILHEYYQFSPQLASEIERDELTRKAVLRFVVRPLVAWFSLSRIVGLEKSDPDAVSIAAQEVLTVCPRHLATIIVPILEAVHKQRPLPVEAPEQLFAFAPTIQQAASLPLASWALLDPLLRAWSVTVRHLDVIDEVSQWLASAPVELFVPLTDPAVLDAEFATLAGFFDFQPVARLRMGSRLAAALPDVTSMLQRHGFIGGRG
ncbi:MAG: hypothetical protein ABSG69_09840 [Candidatus Acidiferrum sp.]